MAMTAGEIVWKITGDDSGINKTIKKTEKEAKGLGNQFKKMGGVIAGAFAATAAFDFGKKLLRVAGEAEGVGRKFGITFQGITDEANEMATELSKSYGITITESKKLLANTGDLLTGFNFQREEALSLSNQVQSLAADLAAFSGGQVDTQFASEALTKGLFGETEQMKTLGIVVNQNSEEFKNLIKKKMQDEGMTAQQAKAHAVLETAVSQSGNAIGSFAKNADTWVSIQQRLNAQLDSTFIEIGQKLLPGFKKLGLVMLDAGDSSSWVADALGVVATAISDVVGFVADLINAVIDFVNYIDEHFGPAIEVIVEGFKTAAKWVLPVVSALAMIGTGTDEVEKKKDTSSKNDEKRAKKTVAGYKRTTRAVKETEKGVVELSKAFLITQETASKSFGQMESVLSSIAGLSDAISESRISALDRQMEKELEAAGLLEETKQQELEREIEAAEMAGDVKTAEEKKRSLERLKIEEKYAKRKAKLEHQAAMVTWEMQLALAVAQLPIMIMNAYSSGAAIPIIGAVMGPLYAALAAAAGGVQIAAIAAAKPKAPSFQMGGIVPGSMLAGDAMAAQVNSGEMILNSAQQTRLFDIADGRQTGQSGNISIYIGDDMIYDNMYQATRNGDLIIDTRSLVTA